MTCNDCPNLTNGTCCHRAIGNDYDKRVNDDADRHVLMMNKANQSKERRKNEKRA